MRYTDEQKQAALDCLAANEGDYRKTSERLGVSVKTLRRWAQQAQHRGDELQIMRHSLQDFATALEEERKSFTDPISMEQWMTNELPLQMARGAEKLLMYADEKAADASLSQIASMFGQYVDKMIKLRAMAPQNKVQGLNVRYFYPDRDGNDMAHVAPPWASEDSEA